MNFLVYCTVQYREVRLEIQNKLNERVSLFFLLRSNYNVQQVVLLMIELLQDFRDSQPTIISLSQVFFLFIFSSKISGCRSTGTITCMYLQLLIGYIQFHHRQCIK